MVETIEQIQRRPEYIEQREKALLDQVFGKYDAKTGKWSGGTLQQGNLFNIPEYRLAGESGLTQGARELAGSQEFLNRYQPYFDASSQFLGRGAGAIESGLGSLDQAQQYFMPAAQSVIGGQGSYDPNSVGAFMDPYQQYVLDAAMQNLDRQGEVARQKGAAQAVNAGAFGGSREGIQRAETERAILDSKSEGAAKILSSGYNLAQDAAMKSYEDTKNRNIESGRILGGIGSAEGSVGQQYGDLGSSYNSMGGTAADIGRVYGALAPADINLLSGLGLSETQYNQAAIDTARQEGLRYFEQATMPIQYGYDVLSGTPSASMTTQFTSTTPEAANPFLQGVGAYTAIQGIS